MYTITTRHGVVPLTDFGIADSGDYAGNEEGSREFFEDAHRVFNNWLLSGMTQEEYFAGVPYFEISQDEEFDIILAFNTFQGSA